MKNRRSKNLQLKINSFLIIAASGSSIVLHPIKESFKLMFFFSCVQQEIKRNIYIESSET